MGDKATARKKNKIEGKPLCKYGSSCYQKNPDHLLHYRHPSPKPARMNEDSKNVEAERDSPPKRKKADKQSLSLSGDLNKIMKEVFLVEMPQDFYDLWEFCKSINRTNPEDIFSDLGIHLVGPFDILSQKLDWKKKKTDFLCHWRYYYDPPEFQTVIKKDGKDFYHIGYFRDDPQEMPSIMASNSAANGAKLTLMGDNIFAAMESELKKSIEKANKSVKEKFLELQKEMRKFAKSKKYSLDTRTPKTKARDKKVVAKTFHGLGVVVPYNKDLEIGYRPLPENDTSLKRLLKHISEAKTEEQRMKGLDELQEIITNVQFANDECDYGTGLELGTDLFCFGSSCFHGDVNFLLSVAYQLLKRPEFGDIIKAHLKNRRNGDSLSAEI